MLQRIFREILIFFRSYPFYCQFLYHHLFDLHLINSEPHTHVLCQLLYIKIGNMYPKKKAKSLQLYTRTTDEKRISLTSIGLIKNFLKCIIYNLCSLTGAQNYDVRTRESTCSIYDSRWLCVVSDQLGFLLIRIKVKCVQQKNLCLGNQSNTLTLTEFLIIKSSIQSFAMFINAPYYFSCVFNK